MATNISSRLGTEPTGLQDLLFGIQRGEIKIPKFQREFIWHKGQAVDLLDSIGHNYPIGSLLFWKTNLKLRAERNIGDFMLPSTDDMTPTLYVLDGQQRLTVIYSCLGAGLEEGGFAAGYDLGAGEFVELPANPKPTIFPLRVLFRTTQLLDYRTALGSAQEQLDELIHVFMNYKIPVVTLKDLTVEEVCPIFERINKSGTKLSTYDLMVAATWSETFDLNDQAEQISGMLDPKGFGDIDRQTILKCLSCVHSGSVKREHILGLRKLRPAEVSALAATTGEALLRVVDLLSTEFRIYNWDFLPYEALVLILCRVYAERRLLTSDQIARAREWFWRAGFSERYRGASDTYITRDIADVYDYVVEGSGSAERFGVVPSVSDLIRVDFRGANSRSRAFALALATLKPRNITNGALVDVAEALSSFNKKHFHHIYPKGFLKRSGGEGNPNSLMNICMIAASENSSIGDSDPREYLPACAKRLRDGRAVFRSNLLPQPIVTDYAALPYDEFLQLRAHLAQQLMASLCTGLAP